MVVLERLPAYMSFIDILIEPNMEGTGGGATSDVHDELYYI